MSALPTYTAALKERIAAILPELKIFTIGHLADGNMHLTISCGRPIAELHDEIRRAVNEGLAAMGGSWRYFTVAASARRWSITRYSSDTVSL